ERGGKAPVITSHSVMDSPDPVSRVMPPISTCMMIIPTPTRSQTATGREERWIVTEAIVAAKVTAA
ncbi:MAG: hypothetical protein RJA57_436, partial [Bacteroidota bacterium]